MSTEPSTELEVALTVLILEAWDLHHDAIWDGRDDLPNPKVLASVAASIVLEALL